MTAVEVYAEPRLARPAGEAPRRIRWKLIAFVLLAAVLGVEIVVIVPYLERAWSALDQPDIGWLALAVVAELMSMGAFARVQRRMLSAGGCAGADVPHGGPHLRCERVERQHPGRHGALVRLCLQTAAGVGCDRSGRRLHDRGLGPAQHAVVRAACGGVRRLGRQRRARFTAGHRRRGRRSGAGAVDAPPPQARSAGTDRRSQSQAREPPHASRAGGRLSALHRILAELSAIKPRNRDWLAGLGFAELNWVADLACLAACCHAVGASGSSLLLVTVAYIAGMSTSGLSLLPGGLGVVDAAMIFALTQGGVSTVHATAGVLLYRLISFALVVALGWLIWAATWLADRRRAAQA